MMPSIFRRGRPLAIGAAATLAAIAIALSTLATSAQQGFVTPAIHAKVTGRLVIKNAMVIYGNAKPAYGPMDIVVQSGRIASVSPSSNVSSRTAGGLSTIIDATGSCHVMRRVPSNAHMHWHEERQPGIAAADSA